MNEWQTMETAPKNRPIWVYYDHEAAPYFEEDGKTLTTYGAHYEGVGTRCIGPGQCVAVWGGEYHESDWEAGIDFTIPEWWFEAGSDFEDVIFPIAWRELPTAPSWARHQPTEETT